MRVLLRRETPFLFCAIRTRRAAEIVWDASVDRHVDVAIDIDLIVVKIWRRSNCSEARRRKAVAIFRTLQGFRPLPDTRGSETLATGSEAAITQPFSSH
jgi:hypothetical protein